MNAWTSKPVLTCRSCGTELPSDAKFCWQCGNPINPGTDSPQLTEVNGAQALHELIAAAVDYEKYYDDKPLKSFLAQFPGAANEPVGKERRTALHKAAYGFPQLEGAESPVFRRANRTTVMNALLEVPGIDPNARDWEENTPLHHAVSCCLRLPPGNDDQQADILDPFVLNVQIDIITGLLNVGADPNAANKAGTTPVHLAAERGRNHVLYHLMCVYGGDPLVLDNRRWSAIHYATQFGYTHVLKLINEELQDRAQADQPAPLPEPFTRNAD